jgi:hypothetical protein
VPALAAPAPTTANDMRKRVVKRIDPPPLQQDDALIERRQFLLSL